MPGIRALLAELHAEVDRLEASVEPSWEGLVQPLERIVDRLSRAWGTVSHLKAVKDTEELRKVGGCGRVGWWDGRAGGAAGAGHACTRRPAVVCWPSRVGNFGLHFTPALAALTNASQGGGCAWRST